MVTIQTFILKSDVDIVIRLDDCFTEDWSDLSEQEKSAYKPVFPKIYYTLVAFKQDVLRVLGEQYGNAAVHAGNKAIAINANSSRRKADVIVSCQHQRYLPSRSARDSCYVAGIYFLNSSKEPIINYPQQHSANLTSKHQATMGRLKPMIRIFKNIRNRLVKDSKIKASMAPSYYVEGLLYNVPEAKFVGSYQDCVTNVLNWYIKEAEKSQLTCANEQYYLLQDSHVCWNRADCDKFISTVVKFWNKW